MAVGSHQHPPFTLPVKGAQFVGVADRVRGNDNALRTTYNDHDADIGVHVSDGIVNVEAYRAAHVTDTATVQAAMNAAQGKTLEFNPNLTYNLTSSIAGVSGVTLNLGRAIIRADVRVPGGYFMWNAKAGVRVIGGTFDQADDLLAVYSPADDVGRQVFNAGVHFINCDDVKVAGSTFIKLYTNAVYGYEMYTRFEILGCNFKALSRNQGIIGEHIVSIVNIGNILIEKCDFDNDVPLTVNRGVVACELSNSRGLATLRGLTINYGGRNSVEGHALGAFCFYTDHDRILVDDCHSVNTIANALRITNARNVTVRASSFTSAATAEPATNLIVIEPTWVAGNTQHGCQNIEVYGNRFFEEFDTARIAIGITSWDYATPATDISVHNNEFEGIAKVVQIQGPCNRIGFKHNQIKGVNGGQFYYSVDTPLATGELGGVLQADSVVKDIQVDDNVWDTPTSGTTPVLLDFVGTNPFGLGPYTGTIGKHYVRRNTFRRASPAAAQAIIVYGVAGKGEVHVLGNEFENFYGAVYASNIPLIVAEDNTLLGVGTPFQNVGGVVSFVTRRNKYGLDPMAGTATLVSGTVTVFTGQAKADMHGLWNIRLLRAAVNGATALGHLVLYSTNSGVSFTVRSVQADGVTVETGDTSIVLWDIDH